MTLSNTFPSLASPVQSQTALADDPGPSAHHYSGLAATAPSGEQSRWGRSTGSGRSARPSAGLTASSVSRCATGSPRKQAAGLTAMMMMRWGRSAVLPGSLPLQPPVTSWPSLDVQQVSLPLIRRGCARRACGAARGRARQGRPSVDRLPVSLTAVLARRERSAGPRG